MSTGLFNPRFGGTQDYKSDMSDDFQRRHFDKIGALDNAITNTGISQQNADINRQTMLNRNTNTQRQLGIGEQNAITNRMGMNKGLPSAANQYGAPRLGSNYIPGQFSSSIDKMFNPADNMDSNGFNTNFLGTNFNF